MLALVPLAKASPVAKPRVSGGEDHLRAQWQCPTFSLFFQLALTGWIHRGRNRLSGSFRFCHGWPSLNLCVRPKPPWLLIDPLLFSQSTGNWNCGSFALWRFSMIFNCYFCWRKQVKAEANNQKKNSFLSVKGSFVKITNILQGSPNWECSEPCQTRRGWTACWTEG